MPKEFRLQRMADLIRTTLAHTILQDEFTHNFKDTVIQEVVLSKDLSLAKIYVSFIDAADHESSIVALNQAAKTLRYKLAQKCMLRITPALKFYYDDSSAQGQKITELLNQAIQGQE